MGRGLDDLIQFLVRQIALEGDAGASTSDFKDFVSQYYRANGDAESTRARQVDKAFLNQVWTWLNAHPDIQLSTDSEHARRWTLDQVEAHNAALPPTPGVGEATDASAAAPESVEMRLRSSEDQMWLVLTGHGPDHRLVPAFEFACLSVIGSRREQGIVQPLLTRITGQDKRSLPERTTRLVEKGYIVKRKVLHAGSATSLCILRQFATKDLPEKQGLSQYDGSWVQHRFSKYEHYIREALEIIESRTVVSWTDLRALVDIPERSVVGRRVLEALKRFEFLGCLERVRAVHATAPSPYGKTLGYRSIRSLRPSSDDDWARFFALGRECPEWKAAGASASDSADRPVLETDVSPVVDDDDFAEDDAEAEQSDAPVLWTPDRHIISICFDAVASFGPSGAITADVCNLTAGPFFHRSISSLLFALTNTWYANRPLDLTLVRDSIQSGKKQYYKYYTFDTFLSAAGRGDSTWEAIQRPRPTRLQLEESADFGSIPSAAFHPSDTGAATLAEAAEPVQAQARRSQGLAPRRIVDRRLASVKRPEGEDPPNPVLAQSRNSGSRKYSTQLSQEDFDAMSDEKRRKVQNAINVGRRYHVKKLQALVDELCKVKKLSPEEAMVSIEQTLDAAAVDAGENSTAVVRASVLSEMLVKHRNSLYLPSKLAHSLPLVTPSGATSSRRKSKAVGQQNKTRASRRESVQVPASSSEDKPSLAAHSLPSIDEAELPLGRGKPRKGRASKTNITVEAQTATGSATRPPTELTAEPLPPPVPTGKGSVPAITDKPTAVPLLSPARPETGQTFTSIGSSPVSRAGRVRKQTARAIEAENVRKGGGVTVETTDLHSQERIRERASTVGSTAKHKALSHEEQYAAMPEVKTGMNLGPRCRLRRKAKGAAPLSRLMVIKLPFLKTTKSANTDDGAETEKIASPGPVNSITVTIEHSQSGKRSRDDGPESQSKSVVSQNKKRRTAKSDTQIWKGLPRGHEIAQLQSDGLGTPSQESLATLRENDDPASRTDAGSLSAIQSQDASEAPLVRELEKWSRKARSPATSRIAKKATGGSNDPSSNEPLPPAAPVSGTLAGSNQNAVARTAPTSETHASQNGSAAATSKEASAMVLQTGDAHEPKTSDVSGGVSGERPSSRAQPAASAAVVPRHAWRRAAKQSRNPSSTSEVVAADSDDTSKLPKVMEGPNRYSGSGSAAKKKIILDVITLCDGVFPGEREIWYPFTGIWMRQHGGSKPDTRTLTNLYKQLVSSGKIRRYGFNFTTARGETKIRHVVTLPHISPDDPRVAATKERMISCFPRLYVPEEAGVDEAFRKHPETWWTAGEPRATWASKTVKATLSMLPIPSHVSASLRTEKSTAIERLRAWQDNVLFRNRLHVEEAPDDDSASATPKDLGFPRQRQPKTYAANDVRRELNLAQQLKEADARLGPPAFVIPRYESQPHLNSSQTSYPSPRVQRANALSTGEVANQSSEKVAARQARVNRLESLQQLRTRPAADAAAENTEASNRIKSLQQRLAGYARPTPPRLPVRLPRMPRSGPKNGARSPGSHGAHQYFEHVWVDTHPTATPVDDITRRSNLDAVQQYFPATMTFGTFMEPPAWFIPKSLADIRTRKWDGKNKIRFRANRTNWDLFNIRLREIEEWELNDPAAANMISQKPVFINVPAIVEPDDLPVLHGSLDRNPKTWPVSMERKIDNIGALKKRGPGENQFRGPRKRRHITKPNVDDDRTLLLAMIISRTLFQSGDDRYTDWEVVKFLTGGRYSEAELRRKWSLLRVPWRSWYVPTKERFEREYLAAYASGIVPELKYENPEDNDWSALMTWACERFDDSAEPARRPQPPSSQDLPATRRQLDEKFSFVVAPTTLDNDIFEVKFKWTRGSKRRTWLHMLPLAVQETLGAAKAIGEALGDDSVARSWVRANALTPSNTYDNVLASRKLQTMAESDLDLGVKQLLDMKLLRQCNKSREAPGRAFDISERYISSFKAGLEPRNFEQAYNCKVQLDSAFKAGKRFMFDYHAPEGYTLPVVNLLAAGAIRVSPVGIKSSVFTYDKTYRTRTMDRDNLRFDVQIEPTNEYIQGSPLSRVLRPRGLPRIDGAGTDKTPIPGWVDLNGDDIEAIWGLIVCALLSIMAVRPSIVLEELEEWVGPSLEPWEIKLLMEWAVKAGVAGWDDERQSTIRLRPYWWAALSV